TVTVSIDGDEFAATTELDVGRFGMLSAIASPGCAFTGFVVRSTPPISVYRWNFTTSRYLGLPDLLDTFAGDVWPLEGAHAGPGRARSRSERRSRPAGHRRRRSRCRAGAAGGGRRCRRRR